MATAGYCLTSKAQPAAMGAAIDVPPFVLRMKSAMPLWMPHCRVAVCMERAGGAVFVVLGGHQRNERPNKKYKKRRRGSFLRQGKGHIGATSARDLTPGI